jgi:hypothetical protein
MKYQIGDKILILHSKEEGTVIDLIDDKMVMVDVGGVQFPAYKDQIDFPYFTMFTQKKEIDLKKIFVDQLPKEKSVKKKNSASGVFLNIYPVYQKDVFDDNIVEKLKIFLINNNEEGYKFHYKLIQNNQTVFDLNNTLKDFSDFYLNDIAFDGLVYSPNFIFEFSLEVPNKKKAPYFERVIKLSGKQIFKKIKQIELLNEPSFVIELFYQYPAFVKEEKSGNVDLPSKGQSVYSITEVKKILPIPPSAVDLHAEKLVEDPASFTSAELLHLQINEFEKQLDLALLHHLPYMVFIHGIGAGKLKTELHHRLKKEARVKSFENKFHSLYGYGATEVHLEQ